MTGTSGRTAVRPSIEAISAGRSCANAWRGQGGQLFAPPLKLVARRRGRYPAQRQGGQLFAPPLKRSVVWSLLLAGLRSSGRTAVRPSIEAPSMVNPSTFVKSRQGGQLFAPPLKPRGHTERSDDSAVSGRTAVRPSIEAPSMVNPSTFVKSRQGGQLFAPPLKPRGHTERSDDSAVSGRTAVRPSIEARPCA